jgi:alkylation response protein AidB-like acyl-CoA dehydrogenase
MDLQLSDDQQLFAETTRRFLKERWPISAVRRLADESRCAERDSLMKQAAELGWPSLLTDSEDEKGGVAQTGPANVAIVAELAGAALLCTPTLPSAIVTYALLRSTSRSPQFKSILEALLDGQLNAGWALTQPDRWTSAAGPPIATPMEAGYRLNGSVSPVDCGLAADYFLVSAATADGPAQFLIAAESDGVSLTSLQTLDVTRDLSRLELSDVVVPAEMMVGHAGADAEIDAQWSFAVALQCAQSVGAAQQAFDMTLDYVKERKSFGRPIGSYQALKHRLADMLLWLESAKAVTTAAVDSVGDSGGAVLASVAKAYVGDYCPRIARECLQLHGGIGFTWEHDIHLYLRRLETDAALYGGVDYHLGRLAEAAVFPRAKDVGAK